MSSREAAGASASGDASALLLRSASTNDAELLDEQRRRVSGLTGLQRFRSASGMSPADLRSAITAVRSDTTLDAAAKARKIQDLMTTSHRENRAAKLAAELAKAAEELSHPSYATGDAAGVDGEKILGCAHYRRGCRISAPCCDEFYVCRFCHDERADHSIDRYAINRTQCMRCGAEQGVVRNCGECGEDFARYFCEPCRFYDDHEDKNIYHCPKCKICRIGQGLGIDYFHCDRCNACMSMALENHKCVERSLESSCPVCREYMFTSVTPVMFLPCGHCMHVECYEAYTETNWVCPLCSKALGDMGQYFDRIAAVLDKEKMPDEYEGMTSLVFCADCEERSRAPYHFVYHACQMCGSFNTKVLRTLSAEESRASDVREALNGDVATDGQVDGAKGA